MIRHEDHDGAIRQPVALELAKEGMSVECSITRGGQTQPVVVTVTSADGDAIEFDYSAKP